MTVLWQPCSSLAEVVAVGKDRIVNGSFETGDFTGWTAMMLSSAKIQQVFGAYDGVYYLWFPVNTEGWLQQTLPWVPQDYVLIFAFRVGSYGTGYLGALGTCGFGGSPTFFVERNDEGTFPMLIYTAKGRKWSGNLYGSNIENDCWLTPWHLMMVQRFKEEYADFYLDGQWIFRDELEPSQIIKIDTSITASPTLPGFFNFDRIQLVT